MPKNELAGSKLLELERALLEPRFLRRSVVVRFDAWVQAHRVLPNGPELLTNASRLLSGDQDGTLIVPWPPYTYAITRDSPPPMGQFYVYVGMVTFYGLLYTLILLMVGLVLFEDRDLA